MKTKVAGNGLELSDSTHGNLQSVYFFFENPIGALIYHHKNEQGNGRNPLPSRTELKNCRNVPTFQSTNTHRTRAILQGRKIPFYIFTSISKSYSNSGSTKLFTRQRTHESNLFNDAIFVAVFRCFSHFVFFLLSCSTKHVQISPGSFLLLLAIAN